MIVNGLIHSRMQSRYELPWCFRLEILALWAQVNQTYLGLAEIFDA